jgi:3-hydroxybutyryl-CoA dehydrogenase
LSDFKKIGVIGGGLMGSGIAEMCARAGLDVTVVEVGSAALDAARARLRASLERAAARGKVTRDDAANAIARVSYTVDLDDCGDRDLVIEAAAEDESVKTDVFARLDKVVIRPDAVLASNTSSIPIMKIAMATGRAANVIGMHFFNPAPVLPLVELTPSLLTSGDTTERTAGFATDVLGKTVVRAKDRSGFVVNALLVPYLLSAIRMLETGFAAAEDIDAGMVHGCAHPMGPLRLADLIGLDTTKAVADSMYEEFKEPLYAAPPLLLRMVDAGLYGKKSGRGFYDYRHEA